MKAARVNETIHIENVLVSKSCCVLLVQEAIAFNLRMQEERA
jgi:hypothetical protein